MYKTCRGEYEKEYWINRIKLMIKRINDLKEDSNIDEEKIMQDCERNSEDYSIGLYFYYRNKYREMYREIISDK